MAHRDAVGIAVRPVERLGRRDDRLPKAEGKQRASVVVEEPLEIRIDGTPIATTLRTPGDDGLLALGFLFGEGVIRSVDDVCPLTPCGRPGPGHDSSGTVIDVRSGPGVVLDVERALGGRLIAAARSASGVCGRLSVEALIARLGTVSGGAALSLDQLTACVDRLRVAQRGSSRSGANAAAAFTASGSLLSAHEDVGRHNAVDKVIGELLRRRLVGAGSIAARTGEEPAVLAVSGRVSFEIVQKAAAAGIPVIASASAASSLAIDLASAVRITLAASVRGGALSVYACPERLDAGFGALIAPTAPIAPIAPIAAE